MTKDDYDHLANEKWIKMEDVLALITGTRFGMGSAVLSGIMDNYFGSISKVVKREGWKSRPSCIGNVYFQFQVFSSAIWLV